MEFPNLSIGDFRKFRNNNEDVSEIGQISDGYHTFDELYEHRCLLFLLALQYMECRGDGGWCSKKHADGSEWEGWFIAGANLRQNDRHILPITYHLPIKYWKKAINYCIVLETAPEWDGHTSDDVLTRILNSL